MVWIYWQKSESSVNQGGRARLDFKIDEWGGGSVGGREDIFIQEADLCSECAHKLQRFIENELNIQPHHP